MCAHRESEEALDECWRSASDVVSGFFQDLSLCFCLCFFLSAASGVESQLSILLKNPSSFCGFCLSCITLSGRLLG